MDSKYLYSSKVPSIKVGDIPNPTTRYDRKTTMIFPEGDMTRMLKANELKVEPKDTDEIITVPIQFQYDPWRVAYHYYGNPDLFWVILGSNDLFGMFDLVAGLKIRIPTISDIFGTDGLMEIGDEY